jgi:hypothetical protein
MQKTKKSSAKTKMGLHKELAAAMMRQGVQAGVQQMQHRPSQQPQAAHGSRSAASPCSSKSLHGLL